MCFKLHRGGLGLDKHADDEDHDECRGKGQRHDREKLARRNGIIGIEVEVLRIAEGREHAAEVGGDVLHDEHERRQLFVAARLQHEVPERQKSDERHIIRHDHRAEEGDEHERQRDVAHIFEAAHDDVRHPDEKADIFERRHDGERAKKTCQRAPVEIVRIRLVKGHEDAGDPRRDQRHQQHDVALDKARRHAQEGVMMNLTVDCGALRRARLPALRLALLFCLCVLRLRLFFAAGVFLAHISSSPIVFPAESIAQTCMKCKQKCAVPPIFFAAKRRARRMIIMRRARLRRALYFPRNKASRSAIRRSTLSR